MDKPGSRRGRAHDADGARKAILDAAENVFAEHGFDGARIDVIAAASGYNKSLIFQYYGDKLALYAEVIRRADNQTRSMQDEALDNLTLINKTFDMAQVKALLGVYLGKYFDYLIENPNIQRIYMWELAEGWQTFSKIISQRDLDDVDQFEPVLAQLQQAGFLRSDPNPMLQLSGSLFIVPMLLSLPPLYKAMTPGVDMNSPAALERMRQYLIEFIANGLLVIPPETTM